VALIINEEQQMLKESAKGFFAEFAPMSELRRLREDGSDYCHSLWKKMVDMGWAAILVPEKYGGLEFGHVGMGQIMEQSGRALAASPLFSSAVIGVSAINLLGDGRQKETLLPQIAAGRLMLALAMKKDPAQLIGSLRENGLLVVGAGGNSIRFLPPLNVRVNEIEKALKITEDVLSSFQSKQSK